MSLPAAAATCIVAASFLGKVTVQMGPPVPALNKTNQTELEQACGGCTEPSYENSQYYPLLAVTRAAHETSQGDPLLSVIRFAVRTQARNCRRRPVTAVMRPRPICRQIVLIRIWYKAEHAHAALHHEGGTIMAKSILTGTAVSVALAVGAGNADAQGHKSHVYKPHMHMTMTAPTLSSLRAKGGFLHDCVRITFPQCGAGGFHGPND
jgi:hypothetical protein